MGRAGRSSRAAAVVSTAAVAMLAGTPAAAAGDDPPFSVDADALDESLDCPEFRHVEREPVLLVHGTGTHGHEQFDWNWLQVLPARGFDVCVVTYPDRGLGDQQVSAEYVAHAVMTMREATGRQVDLMGHSQGASMPRWAIRFWPSVQAAIDDYVGIAGPYHGTSGLSGGSVSGGGAMMPAGIFQFSGESRFATILNEGDETPGAIDWTNLATALDELVQPPSTAFLDRDQDNPRVANILLQDLCPGRLVDHVTIGTTDRLAFDLAVDAFTNDGPADPARLGLGPECAVADQLVEDPQQVLSLVDLLAHELEVGLPALHLTTEEPATRDYAAADGAEPATDASASPAPTPEPTDVVATPVATPVATAAPIAAPVADTATAGLRALPATGGGLGALGLGLLSVAALARRRRRQVAAAGTGAVAGVTSPTARCGRPSRSPGPRARPGRRTRGGRRTPW